LSKGKSSLERDRRAQGWSLARQRLRMNTAIVSYLLDKPWFAVNALITAALPGAALAYGLVWWAMRPRDGGKLPGPFALHAVGLMTTVVVSAICRLISIATFGGREALELAGSGVAGLYILVIPAIVAAMFFAWRRRGLTTPAAPDAPFAPGNEAPVSMKSAAGPGDPGPAKNASAEEFAQIEAGRVDQRGWSRVSARPGGGDSKT
jgi:hypothetical protein